MGIEKFEVLASIAGNNDKVKYVEENKEDIEFIAALRFFCDDSVVTNISSKKLDKNPALKGFKEINSAIEFIDFISNTTGTDLDVCSVNDYIELNPKLATILTGLVIKKYPIKFGSKFFNRIFRDDPIKVNPYMGCISYSKKKVDELFEKHPYLISQIKNDGQFLNIFVNCEECFTARSGIKQHINGRVRAMKETIEKNFKQKFVITGELMIEGYDRHTANGIIRSLISSNKKISEGDTKEASKFLKKYSKSIKEIEDKLFVVAWDLVYLEEFLGAVEEDNRTAYTDRIKDLRHIVDFLKSEGIEDVLKLTEQKTVKNFSEAMEHLKEVLNSGGEGTVLKSLDDNYFEDGKHNYQIKMKVEFTVDLEVISINEGKKGSIREGKLGSVTAKSKCGKLVTGVSGFTEEMQDIIWSEKDSWIGKIIEVKCNGTSENRDGGRGLLYANFKSLREDKEEADTLEEILKAENAAFELGEMLK